MNVAPLEGESAVIKPMDKARIFRKREGSSQSSSRIKRSVVFRESRSVRFSTIKPEIFYYHPTFGEDDMANNPLEDAEGHSELQTSRLTEELTLLSTTHGRARRELRDISKLDLQTVVKYGTKTPARTVNGERRFKFEFGNIVYITDETCTTEITSYKHSVRIEPANITPKMREDNHETKRILQQDPHLCTTHSIIIVDQSGSMRESDVNGFRSRSHAAYGTLALDYVAEQLYSRGGEFLVDAVTIIEMNDTGSLFVDREPLDWILFNKLLQRQSEARPCSHGNYVNSLQLAENIINRELSYLSDLDKDDLPAYALVILSDGKPSDKSVEDEERRTNIVERLAQQLSSKLTVFGMGIGAKGADFEKLETLVYHAKAFGSEGQFTHAGFSSALISTALSSIASSMTSTRTKLLTEKDGKMDKTEKNYTMRQKLEGVAKELPSRRFTDGTSRWKYDNRRSYPWEKKNFANCSATGFEMENYPFGKGAERLAYRFYEVRPQREGGERGWKRVGKTMVAKESRFIEDEERKESFHYHFCRAQHKAKEFANAFNNAVRKSPMLKPAKEEVSQPPLILFLQCHVYEYMTAGVKCGVLVESFLDGKFTKYNSNNGYVNVAPEGSTIELEVGEVQLTDFVQAFSHWVYVSTDQRMLVCDLQGILNRECRFPKFELTDPAICTKGRKHKRYGKTDLGMKGIRNFCRTHKCNDVCKGLSLPTIRRGNSNC